MENNFFQLDFPISYTCGVSRALNFVETSLVTNFKYIPTL